MDTESATIFSSFSCSLSPFPLLSLALSLAPDDGHSVARQSGLSDSHLLLPPDLFFTRLSSISSSLPLFVSFLLRTAISHLALDTHKHLAVVLSVMYGGLTGRERVCSVCLCST